MQEVSCQIVWHIGLANNLMLRREKIGPKNMEEKNNTQNAQNESPIPDLEESEKNQAAKSSGSGKKESSKKKTTSRKQSGNDQKVHKELEETKDKLAEVLEKYLRLSAEYDNYRKRTLKEKMDLTKTGGERVLLNILPVLDNLDRANTAIKDAQDMDAVKIGLDLILNKFKEFTDQNGLKEIEAVNAVFDTDLHEAITKIPTDKEELKGKVVDVIEKGYFLHDKVIRYAKVVVGE